MDYRQGTLLLSPNHTKEGGGGGGKENQQREKGIGCWGQKPSPLIYNWKRSNSVRLAGMGKRISPLKWSLYLEITEKNLTELEERCWTILGEPLFAKQKGGFVHAKHKRQEFPRSQNVRLAGRRGGERIDLETRSNIIQTMGPGADGHERRVSAKSYDHAGDLMENSSAERKENGHTYPNPSGSKKTYCASKLGRGRMAH